MVSLISKSAPFFLSAAAAKELLQQKEHLITLLVQSARTTFSQTVSIE
jgi:hypothetical protein